MLLVIIIVTEEIWLFVKVIEEDGLNQLSLMSSVNIIQKVYI